MVSSTRKMRSPVVFVVFLTRAPGAPGKTAGLFLLTPRQTVASFSPIWLLRIGNTARGDQFMTDSINPENPGLEPYDLSDYTGVAGKNFFDEDVLINYLLQREAAGYGEGHRRAVEEHLRGYGHLVGNRLNELTEAANREGKYGDVIRLDRAGNRIDRVEYCAEQLECRRLSYEYGIVNLDFHAGWKYPFTDFHRMALAYLGNQNGEAGVNCPLAMTEGMIRVLSELGTPEQKKRHLPQVAGENSTSHFMAGQYITERVGGSNVGANRTVARPANISDQRTAAGAGWILNGEKWFCSNPGDLWVTTARIEGTNTIGLFLVSRLKANGDLNGCEIVRKKEIMGSRGKLTVETVYHELEAESLGRPGHGLANLMRYVIDISRLHVAISALGFSRRAFMEAREYARHRTAYGKNLLELPHVLRSLTEMRVLLSAATLTVFRNTVLHEKKRSVCSLLTPVLKYRVSSLATHLIQEAIMIHGGNGILLDFSCLPRLLNDSLVNETWEGVHAVITGHALKAFGRPQTREALLDLIGSNLSCAGKDEALSFPLRRMEELLQSLAALTGQTTFYLDTNRLPSCDLIYNAFALSELIAQTGRTEGPLRNFFVRVSQGFAELTDRAFRGPAAPNGIFTAEETMRTILETD